MSFGQAVSHVFSNYANFSGRARRSEFWWFFLFSGLVLFVAAIIDGAIGTYPIIYGIVALALLVPSIAVGVRRLHDIDKSGWFYLVYLIPLVGFIMMIVWGVTDSTPDNQYGPSPKNVDGMSYA
jgi:uncharacterized membrane protein YhaH (DUF805 family)